MGKPKNKKTSKAEEASDEEIVDIKPKKGAPAKPAKAASSAKASFSALAALEDEDNKLPSDNEDNNNESNNTEEQEPEPEDVKPKKGAKNNKKSSKASKVVEESKSDDEGQESIKPKKNNNKKKSKAESDDDEPAAEPAKPEPTKAKGKKGKKNATDYLASLEEEPAEPQEEKKPEPPKPAEKGKKGKKGKAQEDYLASLEEPAEEPEEKKPEPPKPAPAKGGKKGKKGAAQEDYLASLAEEPAEDVEAKPEPAKPAPAAKGGKKGKKGQSQDDYLASLDEESAEAPKAEESKKPEAKKAEQKKKPEAKKKEEPKKQDKKAPAKAPAKPLNPKLAALKALQEQKKKEEEELQRIEEEKRRQEEELIRKMQEEAEKEKQRQLQLKIEEKRKVKELKKKGLFKTKKQIEQEERAKRMVELMIQQGGIAALDKQKPKEEDAEEEEEEEEEEQQEPVVEKQTKPQKQEKPKVEEQKKETSWEELLSDEDEAPKSSEKSWEDLAIDDEPAQKVEAKKEVKSAEKPAEKPAEKTDEVGEKVAQAKDLRSPICCVLGHVDTGKTKLLDKIRNTNVQLGEAGGITQQIGATYVPMDAVRTQTKKLGEKTKLDFKVPGLLIIDTPGHESFTNLRSRGANLCDIAILVVDIMHGLERQTIESINLLKQKKVPFVVALNKVDQIYDWQNHPNTPIRDSLKNQPKHTIVQFEDLVRRTQGYFQEQGLNAELYYKNKEVKKVVSLVPTSAITGEGMADLLAVVTQLTQMFMAEKIAYKDEFQCTILEVKVVEGHGTTIDVILVNGVIHESDRIVVCTLNGPVVTTIRALLTPKPLREMRVKGEYIQHKQIKAAMGIKIAAQDLDGAVPGSSLLILKEEDDVEEMKEEVMKDLNQLLRKVSKSDRGVYVQSSTLGSLEALLEFLHTSKIPVCGINIGPVHKADVVKASTMLEHAPEFAVILAFDVVVTKDAQEYAEKNGVLIFTANIIYHLFDKFTAHMKKIQDEKKQAALAEAVWPCIIRVIPGNIFHNKDPITIGVDIVEGKLKLQTPIIVPTKQGLEVGRVVGIQHNKQPVTEAEKGKAVAIQIDSGKTLTFGRHFDHTDLLYSKLTRSSLDKLKEVYRDELKTDDLKLIVKIKKVLGVQ